MPLTVSWYLPSGGDARHYVDGIAKTTNADNAQSIASRRAGPSYRPPTLEYLRQVAQSADELGCRTMLVPTSPTCEDPWLTCAALIPYTRRMTLLVAFRPSAIQPVTCAQMIATYQRFSGGRLALNLTPGQPGPTSQRWGDQMTREESYAAIEEYLTVMRGALSGTPFDFHGTYYKVDKADVGTVDPMPPIYFGGSSDRTKALSARVADVYLTMGEPVDLVAQQVARVREMAADHGRTIKTGISLQVVARETYDDALAQAAFMARGVTPEMLRAGRDAMRQSRAAWVERLLKFTGDDVTESAMISKNLWIGGSLIRRAASPTMLGSFEQVADLMEDYMRAGIDEFILNGAPSLEETIWFKQGVMPILRRRGLLDPASHPDAGAGDALRQVTAVA